MIAANGADRLIGPTVGVESDGDFGVKITSTQNRRAKRPRKDVETTEFLGAARRFIRAAGRRVAECDEYELAALIELRADLDAAIAVAVEGQRSYGKSWAAIARGTGATREAAWQKWGKQK